MGRSLSRCFCLSLLCLGAWGGDGDLEFHGFVSQGYLKSSEHDFLAKSREGSFEFSEYALNASLSVSPKLRLGIQFFAQDLGNQGNNKVDVDWAYGDYQWRDYLGIRLGKIKQPLGFYNQIRDAEFLRPTALLPQAVYSEGNRGFSFAYQGICFYGNTAWDIDFEIYGGTTNFDPEFFSIQALFNDFSGGEPTFNNVATNKSLYGASLTWNTPLDGLRIGGSLVDMDLGLEYDVLFEGELYPQKFGVDPLTVYFISAEYARDNFTIIGEYSEIGLDIRTGDGQYITDNTPIGYYGLIAYRFSEYFELSYNYDVFFYKKDDKDGVTLNANLGFPHHYAWQKDHTISMRFDIRQDWNVKLEYHQVDGTGLIYLFESGTYGDDTQGDWHYFAAKTSFNF